MAEAYLGTAGGSETKLEVNVVLPRLDLTAQLKRPPLCDFLWRAIADKAASLVNMLLLHWLRKRLHVIIRRVRVPGAGPAGLSIGGGELVVEGRQGHVCF